MDDKAKLAALLAFRVRDEVALERMRTHGFWPKGEGFPPDPPEEAAERERLEREIAKLSAEHRRNKDPDAALAKERERRIEESRKRRAERRAEREKKAEERRAAWAERRAGEIVHAGLGVSAGLQGRQGDPAPVARLGLPAMQTADDLARRLGIPLGRLRWLTYHREAAALVHYHRFGIPKKAGGIRSISAPKKSLAVAQRWMLSQLLSRLSASGEAHGFVPGRSILSNAAPHAGRKVVVNLDLKDFFPSISFRRVKGLFRKLGYGEHLATLLALLATEPPRVAAEVSGTVFHVALSERVLPQGACTSPAITNALCRRLDRRLAGLARRHGFTFTRYADDLTFSGDDVEAVGRLLRSARVILHEERFVLNEEKTRVMRRGRRQEVTGLTVNDRPAVSRRDVRELRAILHNAARHGLASQNRGGHPRFAAYLRGRVAYVSMVHPPRKASLETALARALAREGA